MTALFGSPAASRGAVFGAAAASMLCLLTLPVPAAAAALQLTPTPEGCASFSAWRQAHGGKLYEAEHATERAQENWRSNCARYQALNSVQGGATFGAVIHLLAPRATPSPPARARTHRRRPRGRRHRDSLGDLADCGTPIQWHTAADTIAIEIAPPSQTLPAHPGLAPHQNDVTLNEMRVPGRGLCAQDEHADLAPNEFAARFGGCLHEDERWQSTAESRSASPRSLSVAGRGRVDQTCAAPRGESCAARMSSRANERMGGGGQRANARALQPLGFRPQHHAS